VGERRYSSYSFLTSAPEGGEWSASRPGRALPPGKVSIVQTAGWAPERVWAMNCVPAAIVETLCVLIADYLRVLKKTFKSTGACAKRKTFAIR
jgi:hypothetical protein